LRSIGREYIGQAKKKKGDASRGEAKKGPPGARRLTPEGPTVPAGERRRDNEGRRSLGNFFRPSKYSKIIYARTGKISMSESRGFRG
jgi:hypothetical protein